MAGNINILVNVMQKIANDDTHGYNQDVRMGGIDFDCSSLVCYALWKAGYTSQWYSWVTQNMRTNLMMLGFSAINNVSASNVRYGDILLNEQHHCCVYLGNGKVAEAVHNEYYNQAGKDWYHGGEPGDQTGDEIRIRDYYNYPWDYIMRPPVVTRQWVVGDRDLTDAEKENNASIIYDYFYALGYSVNAICALLGNMEFESRLSPTQWEDRLPPFQGGYGLIQWTPYTDYARHYSDWDTNHYRQLECINTVDVVNYTPTASYRISWNDFKVSNLSLDYLTHAYYRNRERGTLYGNRTELAQKWYDYFQGYIPPEPPPPTPTGTPSRNKMPLWIKLYITKNL